MTFDAKEHARAMRAAGFWVDTTVDAMFAAAVEKFPGKLALVAYRADQAAPRSFTYSELAGLVSQAAGGLSALGVSRGDVVAVQLPNWWEFVVATLACARLGAVINPLMPIFRERELRFMLEFGEAKVLIGPQSFRDFDHAAMGRALKAAVPRLSHVISVDGAGGDSFEALLRLGQGSELGAGSVLASGTRADVMSVLMFTSGTTGSPKGVMHCDNALVACTDALAARFKLDADEVLLCCAPLGHMTGFAAVMLQFIRLGATLVLQDVWDPKRAVNILTHDGVTYTATSTPFLADICDVVSSGGPRPPRLRKYLCGGAPIPPVLIEHAAQVLGLQVSSLWGMTESLGSTLTEPERATEKSASTDGRALDGVEVRVVDDAGRILSSGQTGRLEVRGAQMFLGYFKRADIKTFDDHGWFDTGDLAYMDDEGYIRINGRTKDVLIRGGENVPVFEIESLLHRHPAILAAAVVGYPDARLGERGCAFVVLRPGATLDLATVQAWMKKSKVAKQYWPERVEILPELPRTPSGKIQKFVLREQVKGFGDQ